MFRKLSVVMMIAVFLTGCQFDGKYQSVSEYCEEKPAICVLIGAMIAGGVVALVNDSRNNEGNNQATVLPGSDLRLKENVRWLETLDNGIRLHAFPYRGDDRIFVGVLAQDVLAMPQFADAVVMHDSGYLTVNYSKLRLRVVGIGEMLAASKTALSKLLLGPANRVIFVMLIGSKWVGSNCSLQAGRFY